MSRPRSGRDGLVRLYVVTGGRSVASRNHFDFVTLIKISSSQLDRTSLTPEQRRVLDLCQPGALSLAEISSHLKLPLSVLRILCADLMDRGHITTGATVLTAQPTNKQVLEAVLAGLRAL